MKGFKVNQIDQTEA